MPAITSGKVLVSGANGYIAVWVVKKLLEDGFSVRGTVRSEDKGTHLQSLFSSYGDKFEVVVVKDITAPGAFDEAVKDVDAVEHTASPFHFHATDPDELIIPAKEGTLSILESTRKFGTNVKRVVVLSSCASVLEPKATKPTKFAEADWNQGSIDTVKEKGKDAPAAEMYRASKTLAEKSAWDFYEKHKGELKWDLVCLNPPFVFGPTLHAVTDAPSLNQSVKDWFNTVVTGGKDNNFLTTAGGCWVDVRDIALAHVKAIKTPEASEQRVIISAGPFKWQDWVNSARKVHPKIAEGDLSYDPSAAVHFVDYDNAKSIKLFSITYIEKDESAAGMIEDLVLTKGWKQ